MIIKNAEVFCEDEFFRNKEIYIEKDEFCDFAVGEVFDASGMIAIPGLTDIHFHGCMGADFCDGTEAAYETIAKYEAKEGITTIVPATMTYPKEKLIEIADAVKSYRSKGYQKGQAALWGINMEGPFISVEKCGAQNTAYISRPDYDFFKEINDASGNCIRLCDIAPEVDGALEFIEKTADECRISLAHMTSDYETAMKAFNLGATHLTHTFNAMEPLNHRAPGPIGAAFDHGNVTVEIITDGIHVSGTMVRMLFKLFGKENVIIISDSMRATGLPDGEYELGGQPVTVQGPSATLHDGTLAGSVTNQMECMRNAILNMNIPLVDAIYSAVVTPARAMGIYDRVGSISTGKLANLVLLDKETLEVKAVWLRGERIR